MIHKCFVNFLQLIIELFGINLPVSHENKPIAAHSIQNSDLKSGGSDGLDGCFMSQIYLILTGGYEIGVDDASLQVVNCREQ